MTSEDDEAKNKDIIVTLGICLFALLGSFSSSVPALIIIFKKSLRIKAMFQTLANLALSETLFLIATSTHLILNATKVEHNRFACSITSSLVGSLALASSFALITTVVERYISVIHGLRYHDILNTVNKNLLLSFSWILSGIYFLISAAAMYSWAAWDKFDGVCLFANNYPPWLLSIIYITILLTNLIVIVMNIIVSRAADRHSRNIHKKSRVIGLVESKNPMRSYKALLRSTMLMLLFILPSNGILLLDQTLWPQGHLTKRLANFLLVVTYILDGWIIGFFNKELKQEYQRVMKKYCCFGCRKKRNSEDPQITSHGATRNIPAISQPEMMHYVQEMRILVNNM